LCVLFSGTKPAETTKRQKDSICDSLMPEEASSHLNVNGRFNRFLFATSKRSNEPPPLAFVSEISAADRVVVFDEGSAVTTFVGAEAVEFIKGLCSAHLDDRSLKEGFLFTLDFYKGTRLLLTTRFSGTRFYVGKVKYAVDWDGVVAALLGTKWADPESYRTWTDTLAERIMQKPGCAQLQDWCVSVLQRYARGELKTQPGLRPYPEVALAELPDWLHAALPGWEVYIVADATGKGECLLLASLGWSGALLVGPPEYVTNQETFRLRWPKIETPVWYMANPSPGIYAYHVGSYALQQSS
jgi:hypothetical protein